MKALFITTSIFLTLALTVLSSRGNIVFGISINTSALIGQGSGPFTLDFELHDGSGAGDRNNTVTIQGLYFGGSSFPTQPALFNLTLTDTAVSQHIFQELWPNTSAASLAFSPTTAMDSGGTPDQFSIKILDRGGTPIPTQGPSDAFLMVGLDSANPVFETFRSDLLRTPIDIPAPFVSDTIIPMPESGVPTILVIASFTALFIGRRQVSKRQKRHNRAQADLF